MADSVGQIGLDLVINQKQFNQQLGGIQKMAKKVGATIIAAFSIKKLVEFSAECLELGSNLEEVQNVVDVTFPKMKAQVDSFAKSAAESFGLSETMAKKFTGTFGAMSKAFGFSEKQAYDMSTALTGLSGDIASFYNISQEEAYTKLKSVFTGETESLKDLGVVMTQSALDAYALANGFNKTTKSMSEAEKVALRYGFVQKQLALAQGDFARTSDSWANQVRLLKLQFDSLKASIGQGLINILTPVIKWLNVLIGKLKVAADAFASFTAALTGKKSSASSAGGVVEDLGDSLIDAGNAGSAAAKKILKAFAPIDEINVIPSQDKGGDSSDVGGGGGVTMPDVGGEITDNKVEESINKWTQALGKFKQQIAPTTDALKRLWNEGLSKLGNFAWTALKDFYNEFLVPLGKWAFGTAGKGFARLIDICNDLLKKINWEKLNKSLKEFWKAIEPYAEQFGEGLIDFFEDIGNLAVGIIDKFPGLLDKITKALNNGDPEKARSWGYGLGVIATSLATIKVGKKILNIYNDLKKLFGLDTAAAALKINGLKGALDSLSTVGKIAVAVTVAIVGFEVGKELGKTLFPDDSEFYEKFRWMGEGGFFDTFTQDFGITFDAMLTMITDFENNPVVATLSTFIAGPFLSGFAWIKKGFDSFGGDAENIKTAFSNFKTSMSEKWNGLEVWFNESVAPWLTKEKWLELWENIKTSVVEMWTGFMDWWNESALVVWFNESVVPWLTREKWIELWENVKQAIVDKCTEIKTDLTTKWESIKTSVLGFIENIKTKAIENFELLKNGIITPIEFVKKTLSTILESIKKTFVTTFNGIWSGIKGVINTIIGGIERMVNGVIGGINGMVRALNGIKFNIPSWVPKLGGNSFGLNIPSLGNVNIPRLAQGGYVKANTPRLAMIGDNTRYGEIVTPENKMFEVMTDALNNFFERFMNLTPQQQVAVEGGDITIPIYLGGQLIDEYIITAQQRKNLRTGGK